MLNGKNIVVIGGGTGLSTLLRGLKKYPVNLTAIVTVMDDGGSSGALRRELGVLPPGDIRNCLVALSEEENLMSRLFQHRFASESSLSGHSFGNLFLTAMTSLTGSFDKAITQTGKVLAIHGNVLPVTLHSVNLSAKLENGEVVRGESKISKAKSHIRKLKIFPTVPPACPHVLEAISHADCIVVGPGSLYTSILPNLLVKGVSSAIRKSKAKTIYVSNIMTQPGETANYTLSDHLQAIKDHTKYSIFDYIIANSGNIPLKIVNRYKDRNSYPVIVDVKNNGEAGLICVNVISKSEFARHDSKKLAKTIIDLVKR